jgi:hypothetical protein
MPIDVIIRKHADEGVGDMNTTVGEHGATAMNEEAHARDKIDDASIASGTERKLKPDGPNHSDNDSRDGGDKASEIIAESVLQMETENDAGQENGYVVDGSSGQVTRKMVNPADGEASDLPNSSVGEHSNNAIEREEPLDGAFIQTTQATEEQDLGDENIKHKEMDVSLLQEGIEQEVLPPFQHPSPAPSDTDVEHEQVSSPKDRVCDAPMGLFTQPTMESDDEDDDDDICDRREDDIHSQPASNPLDPTPADDDYMMSSNLWAGAHEQRPPVEYGVEAPASTYSNDSYDTPPQAECYTDNASNSNAFGRRNIFQNHREPRTDGWREPFRDLFR